MLHAIGQYHTLLVRGFVKNPDIPHDVPDLFVSPAIVDLPLFFPKYPQNYSGYQTVLFMQADSRETVFFPQHDALSSFHRKADTMGVFQRGLFRDDRVNLTQALRNDQKTNFPKMRSHPMCPRL